VEDADKESFTLCRVGVDAGENIDVFKLKVSGLLPKIRRVFLQ